MVRVTVRKQRSQWHVRRDGEVIETAPTRPEAVAVGRRTARDSPGRPALEIREEPGVWKTIAP